MAKAVAKKPVKKTPVKKSGAKHLPEQLRANIWKPGQSGNPKGRAPTGLTIAELTRGFLEVPNNGDKKTRVETILDTLYGLVVDGGSVPAAKLLFERGYGAALPEIPMGDNGHTDEALLVRVIRGLPKDTRLEFAQMIRHEGNGNGQG